MDVQDRTSWREYKDGRKAMREPRSVDLVCLPEMIFTGYVFPDAKAISPHLEDPKTGPTSRFCADLAARLHCYVAAGYPERHGPHEAERRVTDEGNEITTVGANSAVMYGPNGALVGGYRKTNLFETDMTWAKPGTGFVTFDLPSPLNTVSLGICMDLNTEPPAMWTLLDGPYEMANYCIERKTTLLVLLNAWLDSGRGSDEETDWQTVNYWAARLRPLWVKDSVQDERADGQSDDVEETFVIVCNRCGKENGMTFAGSSSLFNMRRGSGKPRLLHTLGRQEESIAVWTIP
ncbi:uncharacterized protein FIBRA_07115 [Fibroporia radiculosa]|uniref:CN hydrolase domain-containing protein n=1 Tax=Fibroporia radiculosa TaxID=599839 RepID=J4GDI4_9APHY|nr:uncharacterized protein FIBRA_07115 [Fibroporia radiculosa]CCM04918.1 predicted protein [Fibroporia radiculosa]